MSLTLYAGSLAAQGKPYQLCETSAPSQAQSLSIESNYRYAPGMVQRNVKSLVGGDRCDLPFEPFNAYAGPGCPWRHSSCGYHDNETPACGDGEGWWLGFDIHRGTYWTNSSSDGFLDIQRWPTNAAVEVHQGFPAFSRIDRYRVWYWEVDVFSQSMGTQDVPYATGNYPRCYTMAHLFGFFNGVCNTRKEAEDSLEAMELQNFLGPKWREAPVRYELFYNQSCKRSDDDVCLQDVAEVFRQRSAELDGLLERRWEYFWEQITGQHDQPGSFTQRLLGRMARSDNALASWFNGLYNAVLAKITALSTLLAENPPTAQDTAEHTAQLIAAGQRAERAVLVAHSQGNLFVNAAYDAYLAHAREVGRSRGKDTNYVAAQVVHIAPASPTLRGPYVLADIDVVINGLRRVDGTYLAVSNFPLERDAKDSSGHKLLGTYLDESRPARAHIRQLITQALDAL